MSTVKARLVHELVLASAERTADAPALAAGKGRIEYEQLAERVRVFGAGLAGAGIERGDRVAVYLEKRVEAVIACFGASVADAAFVPVNPVLMPPQVGHILADSGARALVTSPERLAQLEPVLQETPQAIDVILVGGHAANPSAGKLQVLAWDELRPGTPPSAGIDSDVAAILYTSGSSGLPKGVVLSHRNLVAGAESVNAYLGNTGSDRILAALPLSFDAGFSQLTTGFLAGAEVVLLDYLMPGDVVRACAEHRITAMTCVPPLWAQLAEQRWPHEATEGVRYFASTGGRMPGSVLERLRSIFPDADPYLMYGLTEAFRSTYLDPSEVDRRPDSIGKAIPNAEVLVVREDGTPCEPGEEGELVHRGALVSLGYWNDPERTAERFRPAPGRDPAIPLSEVAVWSGDRVMRDEEGFIYFVGRADEMIKTSGYRVSPTEVEEAAYATGIVDAVVALGVPDDRLGQAIVLVASASQGTLDEEELKRALQHELPRFMVPSRVDVRERLPRSPNGKLDRAALRRELVP